jgi:hypothetical protein
LKEEAKLKYDNAQKEYESGLGRLLTNMLSLEFLLRLYLFKKETKTQDTTFNLNSLKQDDIVPKNYFTDTCTLRPLIDRYNTYCKENFGELCIDPNLADIRNALTHGRVLSSDPTFSKTQLFNFVSEKEGQIRVSFAALMTKDWFAKQIRLFFDAASNVHKRIKNDFPETVGEIEF